MNLRLIALTLFCSIFTFGFSQTLEQAKSMFTNGEYQKAKPAFKRFLRSQPNNANYNYWYGVCCLKTEEPQEAVKPLEFAHKRKVPNAPLYLGQAYDLLYYFDEAIHAYEEHIEALKKKKQATEATQFLLEKSKLAARMLKGVERVCVIDSFVVDKQNFITSYKISKESGSIYSYTDFFQTTGESEGTVYETELRNKIYYSEPGEDGTQNILLKTKMLDDWSSASPLPGSINKDANVNYPFMLTDGMTIYFASDGEGSIGGYDIFVTRYNTGTDNYLTPENVGMPFNSPYNDYMYVIDEYNQLGWFATDRNQPNDKVCIYVFIPNPSKQTYNYENTDPKQMRQLAQLHAIEDTWKDEEAVAAAKKRLEAVLNQEPETEKKHDFTFIVNDQITYHSINDFKSKQAKDSFKKYQQQEKDFRQQKNKLDNQRIWYANASQAEKKKSAPAILDLEKRVQEMSDELDTLIIQVRNQEIRNLKK